jgi:hypothetical protein
VDVTVMGPRRLATGGTIEAAEFNDLGTCQEVRWDGAALTLVFEGTLTQAQVDEARARCDSVNTVEKVLRARAVTALDANRTYLTLAPPSQAQVVAQVNALTRQVNGLIRMVLAVLDDTD